MTRRIYRLCPDACFPSMEVKLELKKLFAQKNVGQFFRSVLIKAGQGVRELCKESHVSSRTYYRILRQKEVKYECYGRLFIGLCHIATYEEMMERWIELGKSLYMRFSEE